MTFSDGGDESLAKDILNYKSLPPERATLITLSTLTQNEAFSLNAYDCNGEIIAELGAIAENFDETTRWSVLESGSSSTYLRLKNNSPQSICSLVIESDSLGIPEDYLNNPYFPRRIAPNEQQVY